MTAVAQGAREIANRSAPKSAEAKRLFEDLMSFEPEFRRTLVNDLPARDIKEILRAARLEAGTEYALYVDDPVGFVEDVLGETTWSKQREVLVALTKKKQVAVPSAFGTGKTHLAARAALWRSLVYPIGTSLTVTTATRLRQVQRQLWPHIRTAVAKADLPLIADMTQLKALDQYGVEQQVAYGFSAPAHDEAAVQGIHAARLFIVIDEAGGISRIIGKAMRGLLTGDDTRLLAIGNPPTDDEGSWFEGLCESDKVETVRISAYTSPQLSGEVTDYCRACPPQVDKHRLSIHIVDKEWIDDTVEEYGEDAPFVIAKVHAKFPRGGSSRVIPADWVDMAYDRAEPEGEGWLPLNQVCGDEEEEWMVQRGAWVRLGVDVAADGGDELVIARSVGDLQTIQHTSSGSTNANAVDVAGKVLTEIMKAQRLRGALGTTAPVRVKIDGIGVGWGVAGLLQAWRSEGVHDADIVVVKVSESTNRDPGDALMRPALKRDEMWLAGRHSLQPRKTTPDEFGLVRMEPGSLRLRVDKRTRAQLSGPTYGTRAAGGTTVIESKKSMKARGLASPDRAEALLLAVYEPLMTEDLGAFRVLA